MAARTIIRRTAGLRRPHARGPLVAVAALALALPGVAAADTSVSISESGYAPAVVTIKQGETVTWVNDGTRDHTVTSDSGKTMNSDLLGPGDSFATIFEAAGTFRYHSTVEPDDMTGTVIVKPAKVATATGPTPPTGTVPEGFGPSAGSTGQGTTSDGATQSDSTDRSTTLLIAGVAVATAIVLAVMLWGRRKGRDSA